jgi:DNA-binding SARP family transcriptional activator/tRNA A-37 threonylcarbamoyl transferase component Bud32
LIELVTLGRAAIRQDGVELGELAAHKQKFALLCYLGIEGPVGRDHLLEIFWPGVEESNARHLLSAAVYSVKKKLSEEVVTTAGHQVAVPTERVKVDVYDLEAASQAECWDEAVRLYEGPFLEHFYLSGLPAFDEWQSRTRAWVGNLGRTAFRQVIISRAGCGDLSGALDIAGRWAKLEPSDDDAQHALIALLAMTGNRAGALAHYDAYRAHLERDLDFEPLEETVRMVEMIQAGELPSGPLLGEPASESTAHVPVVSQAEATGDDARAERPLASAKPGDVDALVKGELEPRLHIVRKLAESSAAHIYLAADPELNRKLAVKVFSPALLSDRRARLRFEREVQAVASLNHPNIATLHWAGSLSNGLPYFVMQYVEGPTLAQKLRLEGPLPNDKARRLLSQIAWALAAAHRRGIVHRDVQPANVLCDEEAGRCLLADFGIAAILSNAQIRSSRITESGELVGDPAWMSPEQLQAERVSERSDVYSLGLLAYQLLAERGPYEAATKQELYTAHVQKEPRELRSLRPDVDRDLADIVERCLAKEPERRPSASFVARVLQAPPDDDEGEREAVGFFARLVERRVPHWLAAYLAGGFGVLQLVEMLEGRLLRPAAFELSLISFVLAIPLVFILAWYHGRSGPQRVTRLEYGLLGGVLAIWLSVLVLYLAL